MTRKLFDRFYAILKTEVAKKLDAYAGKALLSGGVDLNLENENQPDLVPMIVLCAALKDCREDFLYLIKEHQAEVENLENLI